MPDVFPRSEKAKLRLLERGIDLEQLYRRWVVSMVGTERAERFLTPSKKDEPAENLHKTRLAKLTEAAKQKTAAAAVQRKNESVFEKSDRLFSKRLGRR